jgi:hypothetical protein
MDKKRWIWATLQTGIIYGLVIWLVTGNIWLHLALAGAMSGALEALQELRRYKTLFAIADSELVKVSALANSLEEKVANLEVTLSHNGIRM